MNSLSWLGEVRSSFGVVPRASAMERKVESLGSFSPRSSTLKCLMLIPVLEASSSCVSPCDSRISRILLPNETVSTANPSFGMTNLIPQIIIGVLRCNKHAPENYISRSKGWIFSRKKADQIRRSGGLKVASMPDYPADQDLATRLCYLVHLLHLRKSHLHLLRALE